MERSPFVIIGSAFRVRRNSIRSDRGAIFPGSGLATGGNSFDLDAELALELEQFRALFSEKERGGHATFTSAAGAANAMDEVFGNVGKIIVDDVRDILNVDAASCYIGGNEDTILPALETG